MADEKNGSEKNQTSIERTSDCEIVVTRTFNGPASVVFDAWTKPDLVMRWWAPRSFPIKLVKCEIDLRVGGKYSYLFDVEGRAEPMEFFGKYLEVERGKRLAWTNAESDGDPVTTATFTEKDGKTVLTLHERHPTKEALDEHMASGAVQGSRETFEQLDELLASGEKIS